jgi:predicted MFS family arabinose efflux permease
MESTSEGQPANVHVGSRGGSPAQSTSHGSRRSQRIVLAARQQLSGALGVARDGDFARFWAAQSVSQVGTQFSEVALPLLAALSLGATPMGVGLLATAAGLPHLLFGLFAGAWADRVRRRPLMIVADLTRFLLLATIPLAAWRGTLRIELLIAVAFVVESLTVFFDMAYVAYVPSLVPRERLVEANSRLEASASASQVIGPAFGGTLVRLLGAPNAMLIDALSYLASALFLSRIRANEAQPERTAETGIMRDVAVGLTSLWRQPVLRALALASAGVSFGGYLFLSIYVLYLTRTLGLDAGAVGFVFATGGVGALVGSVLATPVRNRWGTGPAIVGSLLLFGVFGLTVPLAVALPRYALLLILASEFLQWLTLVIYNVNAVSLRQAITPNQLLGRVSGGMRFIGVGMRPVGALLGGYLGGRIGLPLTLVVGALGMFVAFAPLLTSPVPRMTSMVTS